MINQIQKIISNEAWLMRPAEHASMMKIVERIEDAPMRQGVNLCGDAVELPSMRVEDGTAIIPVNGVVVRGVSMAEKVNGIVTVEDLEKDIRFAIGSGEVKRVILDIDSPGGMYNGTPEIADLIAELAEVKPMAAFTNGLMASAAYWIGATSGRVYMSKSADVGSVGVVMMWPDVSKATEGRGVKIKVFSSGAFKGMIPEVELTESQESYLQDKVENLANEFYSQIKRVRAGVDESAFDGRTFQAEEAMEMGLVDGLARNVEEVITMMKIEEQMAGLVQEVDQLKAKITKLEADNTALSDLVTEAATKQPESKAQEPLTLEHVKTLIASANPEPVDMEKLAGMISSKMIAATGQPGPIPEQTRKTLTASERTEAHFAKVARQMKGIE